MSWKCKDGDFLPLEISKWDQSLLWSPVFAHRDFVKNVWLAADPINMSEPSLVPDKSMKCGVWWPDSC